MTQPSRLHDHEQLHVDRAFPTVRLRNDVSSQGVDDAEKEANLFAAEILMPERFLQHDLAGRSSLDLYDEDFIPQLAEIRCECTGSDVSATVPRVCGRLSYRQCRSCTTRTSI